MDKRKVDELLPLAVQALDCDHTVASERIGIVKNGTIPKSFRGQISTFGAAVSTGSLLAAIAFFNDKGNAAVDRRKLMMEINWMLEQQGEVKTDTTLFRTVQGAGKTKQPEMKEKVLNCAVALKLAMNLYELTGDNVPSKEG
jgi:CRISPR-associated protein Cmr5